MIGVKCRVLADMLLQPSNISFEIGLASRTYSLPWSDISRPKPTLDDQTESKMLDIRRLKTIEI